jgi:hypothetical protein
MVACEDFVTRQLVAPATAKFPTANHIAISQLDPDKPEWLIVGYVDSENKMGAMLRTDYSCTVRWAPDDELWHQVDLQLRPR